MHNVQSSLNNPEARIHLPPSCRAPCIEEVFADYPGTGHYEANSLCVL